MRRLRKDASTDEALPDSVGVEFTASSLSWSLSAVNIRLVVVWDKPENIGLVDFLCKRPIYNFIKLHLVGSCCCSILCKVDFRHCIAMLVKVRTEVNSFLF